MKYIVALAVFFLINIVTCICGTIGEKRHYRSIREREERLKNILVFNEKMPPAIYLKNEFALVAGSVVMSSDYFRQMVAWLKKIFGGRLASLESALDRGRREAILRMKEEAERMGAKAIFNVRLETSVLTGNQATDGKQQKIFCAEFLAYGTALCAPQKFPEMTGYFNPEVPHEVNVGKNQHILDFLRLFFWHCLALAVGVSLVYAAFNGY